MNKENDMEEEKVFSVEFMKIINDELKGCKEELESLKKKSKEVSEAFWKERERGDRLEEVLDKVKLDLLDEHFENCGFIEDSETGESCDCHVPNIILKIIQVLSKSALDHKEDTHA